MTVTNRRARLESRATVINPSNCNPVIVWVSIFLNLKLLPLVWNSCSLLLTEGIWKLATTYRVFISRRLLKISQIREFFGANHTIFVSSAVGSRTPAVRTSANWIACRAARDFSTGTKSPWSTARLANLRRTMSAWRVDAWWVDMWIFIDS
jgi:hypothetical protein